MADDYVTQYMIDNNLFPQDDYSPRYSWNIDDLEETKILCPECQDDTTLRIGYFGTNNPDDYYSVLLCPKCGYEEQE